MSADFNHLARYFIVAPNVVRVGVDETVVVSVFGTPDGVDIPVTLYFRLSGSNEQISRRTVHVSKGEPGETTLRVSRDDLPDQQTSGQEYVTLVASSQTPQLTFNTERVILLSPRGGFVFIQTDKPLYTPRQRVNIRVVALDQDMVPSDQEVQIDVINPDQIIIKRERKAPTHGFISLTFAFPPKPVFGNWTVTAYYGYMLEASTSVQFEVKEYVLPKFYVEVTTDKMYIVPETRDISIDVTARYLFGEPVFGNFFVKYGVAADDGSITDLYESRGQLNNEGRGYTAMVMEDVAIPNWAVTLMGKRLIIQAYVTDPITLETVNTNNTFVTFSDTPYKFSWDLTQRFFKRELPFLVKANLQYLSGLPAANIPVEISAIGHASDGSEVSLTGENGEGARIRSGKQGELFFRLDVTKAYNLITITLETKDPELVNANTQSSFEVGPQEASSNEYLLVHIPAAPQLQQVDDQGNNVEVHLTNTANLESLNFFVIAGGRILTAKSIPGANVNQNTVLRFSVTYDMAPSARVVAYYIRPDGNVVADALYMEVEEKCENPIELRLKNLDEREGVYKTDGNNKNIQLEISGREDTNVGLLAVDEAVFKLRYYHRLTQKKVFKRMASYDLGCGAGGGQNSAKVFEDAGVAVMSNTLLDVQVREEEGCLVEGGRAKRSVNDTVAEEIESEFEGEELEYCKKGKRQLENPEEMTCAVRAKNLASRKGLDIESPLIEAFLYCCRRFGEVSSIGRAGGGDNDVDLSRIMVRSRFPESWMFTDTKIRGDGTAVHRTTLPDSVTTWVIEAVGVSREYDMCVADPLKLQVRPPFFLDLLMPYSVQRFEQIEIIVSVFNYANIQLEVEVFLKGRESICSEAPSDGYSEARELQIPPNQGASVGFVIVPLEVGSIPIEVVARAKGSQYEDGINKKLLVRPEGYERTDIVSFKLDPERTDEMNLGVGGEAAEDNAAEDNAEEDLFYDHDRLHDEEGSQIDIIRYSLNADAIPGTHQVYVSVTGNVMTNVVATVIGGLDRILAIPTGCGEQTMLKLGPNVYIYKYLRYTDQQDSSLERKIKKYISDGINWEMRYRKADGSFSVWVSGYKSSTWLTAFVAKVFCQARQFDYVDQKTTCKAMQWLIEQTRNPDGSFREIYRVHHREMTGGVQGAVSLTAYVLISLLECECNTYNKDDAVADAREFLEGELDGLTRPYAIAITAYALALAESPRAQDAIEKLKGKETYNRATDSRHWGSDASVFGGGKKPYWYTRRPKAIEVETTSYALLALLQMDEITHSHAIINWLTEQENYNGGFVSTQDTVIALQALSEYAIRTKDSNIDLQCEVTCEANKDTQPFRLQNDNALVRQHAEIAIPEGQAELRVDFRTEGQGTGHAKFMSTYYLRGVEEAECDFDLIVEHNVRQNGKELAYNIKVKYLTGIATGMAILDVGLYTGYRPNKDELDQVKEESKGQIQDYELTDRSVVFYLEEITRDVTSISFHANREFEVGKLQPVSVRVYDYYNPTEECVKFIHPQEGSNMLNTLCTEDKCTCAAGSCGKEIMNELADYDVYDMKVKACESPSHFAYQVRVESVEEEGGFQKYTVHIIAPHKKGKDDLYKGDKRTFWKTDICKHPELELNKNYLVIGRGVLEAKDDVGNIIYKYIIDHDMSFYVWPRRGRVKASDKWKRINNRLKELSEDFLNEGCVS